MASLALSTAVTSVKALLSNPTTPTVMVDASFEEAIKAALVLHNAVRPNYKTLKIAGSAKKYYELAVATYTDWDADHSQILWVEYPAANITNDEDLSELDEDEEWEIVELESSKQYLHFLRETPITTKHFRIRYSYPRVFAGSPLAVTLPPNDVEPFLWLAASLASVPFSAYYAKVFAVDSFNAHTIEWAQVTRELRNLEVRYRKAYDDYIKDVNGKLIAIIDTDSKYPKNQPYGSIHHQKSTR